MPNPDTTPTIRYRNQSDALVTVTKKPDNTGYYNAQCAGCLDQRCSVPLPGARDWASQHARDCRALPINEEDTQ